MFYLLYSVLSSGEVQQIPFGVELRILNQTWSQLCLACFSLLLGVVVGSWEQEIIQLSLSTILWRCLQIQFSLGKADYQQQQELNLKNRHIAFALESTIQEVRLKQCQCTSETYRAFNFWLNIYEVKSSSYTPLCLGPLWVTTYRALSTHHTVPWAHWIYVRQDVNLQWPRRLFLQANGHWIIVHLVLTF